VDEGHGSENDDWLPPFVAEWRTSTTVGYRQLADALRAEIAAGRLGVGTRLPSQRELARLLAFGRTNVVSAYNLLQGESLIRPRRGAGTWVVRRPPDPAARG
jgi:DNA-binding GntR family transcriptional regulator